MGSTTTTRIDIESDRRFRRPEHQLAERSEFVEVEVTLRFRLRGAGWPGNDGMTVSRIANAAVSFFRYMMLGDERMLPVTGRWRRADEKRWKHFAQEDSDAS